MDGVRLKQSDREASRLGLFATEAGAARAGSGLTYAVTSLVAPWLRNANVSLASFPLSSAITAANLSGAEAVALGAGAQLGAGSEAASQLAELQQLGLADERTAVMLHLAAQRAAWRAGGKPALGPWLALLPASFGTPLYWSEDELSWIRGTTLHAAAIVRRRAIEGAWPRLAPAAAALAVAEGGTATPAPTLDDYKWANSVFWSRAITFPTPVSSGLPGTKQLLEMHEGIVPGLDFANHAPGSAARWTVFGAPGAGNGASPGAVSLVVQRKAAPAAGQEVTISYGDKSNEELLFLYGFALQDNPADVLTVMCPLPPPDEWDDVLEGRLRLLAARGRRPQLFLPAAELEGPAGAAPSNAASSGRSLWRPWTWLRRGGGGSAAAVTELALPEGVCDTLEVFVMDSSQLAAELDALDAGGEGHCGAPATAAAAAASGVSSEVETAGLRLAVLTTLVRLLELKSGAMESDDEGTGSPEADEAMLAAKGAQLPPNQLHALLYRLGQKRLARRYLRHVAALLQAEMEYMARLQGMEPK